MVRVACAGEALVAHGRELDPRPDARKPAAEPPARSGAPGWAGTGGEQPSAYAERMIALLVELEAGEEGRKELSRWPPSTSPNRWPAC